MKKQKALTPAAHQPPAPLSPADPLLSPEAASAYFGGVPAPKTLETYRREGIGPDFVKFSGRVYYRRSALDRYLDECTRVMKRSARRTEAA